MPTATASHVTILQGDARPLCRNILDPQSVQCIVTSPPYFRGRQYDAPDLIYGDDARYQYEGPHDHLWDIKGYCACGAWKGQLGDEQFPTEYVLHLREVLRATIPVLKPDGTLWLNLGDCRTGSGYSNHKNTGGVKRAAGGRQRHVYVRGVPVKTLLGMPWRVALALADDGWILRSAIVWHKSNPQPDNVKDRPKTAYEHLFLFARQQRYFYATDWGDWFEAARDVWTFPVQPTPEGHPAIMPEELAKRCIALGSDPGDTVLDPFGGAGTTAIVARRMNRDAIVIDVSQSYVELMEERCS